MRSAESSGVEAGGFTTASSAQTPAGIRLRAALATPSPFTYAIAFIALAAATLFVVADAMRTMDDMRQRRELVERLSTAQPLLARQFAAGSPGRLVGEPDLDAAIAAIAQRGAIAYGLALIMAGLGYRRRQPFAKAGAAETRFLPDLLSTIPFGIACWSTEGRLLVCNEQFRSRVDAGALDIRPGASYAQSVRRLVEGGYMQIVTETDRNRVLELRREDGSFLVIDERPLESGGFVTLISDVTERRRADNMLTSIREEQRILARRYHEEKLRAEAASRSKTSFLAHLSHDIRTPLNHIIGFAELMRHQTYGPLGDARYVGYVDSIRLSGERLLSFFASILDLAELEGGRRVLEAGPLGVDDLLVAVTRRFSAQAQRAGISLSLGTPCGAELIGDRFSLERMMSNLLDNAIRFTPAGGRVSVAAHAASDGVVLEVTDTGIGMGPERLSALSQPFAFGDAALTKDREGAGLGLAIARTIVELSGGRLAIDSRPGLGTTVAVSLPLPAADEVKAA
ncbi:MAG: ATP-binding protein [Devosia sp.]|nr:ATP-binding protein [Devosia sp.]